MSKLKSTFSLQHFKTRLGGKERFRWHQRWISHYMRPRTEADQYCSYSRCCRWSEYETFPNSLPEHFKLNSWQTVNICEKLGQISWLPEFRRYIMMFHCSTLSHGWQEYQSLCLPAMCLHPASCVLICLFNIPHLSWHITYLYDVTRANFTSFTRRIPWMHH